MRSKLITLAIVAIVFTILYVDTQKNNLIYVFSDYSSIISYISYVAIFLTVIYRTKQISSVLINMKAKITGTKKIENQICKNDEVDRIQNIFIKNLDERVKKIENKLYGK